MKSNLSTVDDFINNAKVWQKELILLRNIIERTGLKENIKWGTPVYTYQNKNILGLAAFKNYVGVWFFNGALLKDPLNVLTNAQDGKTIAMRQWRFTSSEEIDEKKLLLYINEAIENQKNGIEIKPVRKKEFSIPKLLNKAFEEDKALETAFKALSEFKQKEYSEYIESAKREETKLQRLEKIKPLVFSGVGLNDKYR